MAVSEDLELSIDSALRSVDRLGQQLDQQARRYKVALADATAVLDNNVPVKIDVDDREVDEARRAVDRIDDSVVRTTQSSTQLSTVFRTIAASALGIAAARFFGDSIEEASALAEQGSAVAINFGDASSVIENLGRTSATALGLSQREALTYANQLGGLIRALGLTEAQAASMSETILGRASDIASFRDLEVTDVLEKIRSGLVGEVEPLRALGVNFNAATVEARAMALGLADANGEVDEAAKVQARLAIVLDQTALAQGNFALTSSGLANQQRTLKAEVANVKAEIGEQLLPVALAAVGVFREEMLPSLRELAERAVPLLEAAFRSGTPIIGSFLDVAVALAPVLEVLARVVSSIPEPLLAMVVTMTALKSPLTSAVTGVSDLVKGLNGAGGAIGSFTAMSVGIGAVTLALGLAVAAISAFNAKKEEQRRRIEEVRAAFEDEADSLDEDIARLAQQRFSGVTDDLRALGLTFQDLQTYALQGQAGTRALFNVLTQNGRATMSDAVIIASKLGTSLSELGLAGYEGGRGLDGMAGETYQLAANIRSFTQDVRDAAQAELDRLVVQEKVTEEQVSAAQEQSRLSDGTVDYLTALRLLNPAAAAAIVSQNGLAVAAETVTDETREAEEAMAKFVQTAVEKLPGITTALQDLEADTSLQQFMTNLAQETVRAQRFIENIASLRRRGATNLAQAFIEAGPQAAAKAAEDAAALSDAALRRQEASLDKFLDANAKAATSYTREVEGTADALDTELRRMEQAVERAKVDDLLKDLGIRAGSALAKGVGEGVVRDIAVATNAAHVLTTAAMQEVRDTLEAGGYTLARPTAPKPAATPKPAAPTGPAGTVPAQDRASVDRSYWVVDGEVLATSTNRRNGRRLAARRRAG